MNKELFERGPIEIERTEQGVVGLELFFAELQAG